MVIPFSNTKLRVPKGFQSLLVGLSTEVLRSQPRNIHQFAAEYFEKLLQRRDQGQEYLPENQSSLEDRYYNNQSFQQDFPVNDPEINQAATKIQAKFRGHKARQNVEKLKQETRQTPDSDQQDFDDIRNDSATPNDDRENDEDLKKASKSPSPKASPRFPDFPTDRKDNNGEIQYVIEPDEEFPPLSAEELEEQERAARSIQARFRGFQARKAGQGSNSPAEGSPRPPDQDSDRKKSSPPSSARLSDKLDTDRQDYEGHSYGDDQNEMGENDESDRPRFERESTKLSEDFERHTQVPRDLDFAREHQADTNNDDDDDMDDSQREKAATRIQASFRGYKTRKDLNPTGSPDHPPPASHPPHQEDEHDQPKISSPTTEGNKELEGEDDDSAAATKIQAAFRGYRTRKEMEKQADTN